MIPTVDKRTITMILQINDYNNMHTIFILHLKTCWCSHRVIVAIIVTQNLLSWNQDGQRRVLHVIFVFKTSKNISQNAKKEQKFWIRKILEKRLFLSTFFDFYQTDKDISLLFRPVIPVGLTITERWNKDKTTIRTIWRYLLMFTLTIANDYPLYALC